MSCCGNTIARALALVTIGTLAAFVHWAIKPPRLSLGPPGADAPRTQSDPGQNDPVTPPQPDGATDGASPAPAGGDEQAAPTQPFDPNSLGSEIGTPDAYQLWLSGAVAFIDARPQKDYVAGHIPYAYLVPAESLADGRLGDMMEFGGVTPSMRVVVYCEGGTCDASHLVALNLQDMGFDKIHIDTDGFPGWLAAGHEVETGPDQVLGDLP